MDSLLQNEKKCPYYAGNPSFLKYVRAHLLDIVGLWENFNNQQLRNSKQML